ncbi:hypothetical protein F4861DRAFT_188816 [Xylaria intraflava]|nr:hypothetical protein F4861DRAFT_188816 [Xylaria intraflava]
MAAAVQIMPSSELTTPIRTSRTTATVREHTCLFSHDLRRKQKRWRDGRLKYHTFNKRVMVYDDRGNFVGDAHWQEDYDLADGDDLELERGGVIVQIGECVERHDQDLSELIDKRTQERAQRQAAAAARRSSTASIATPHTVRHVVGPQTLPPKHLHDVIGTPSGHHGRAVLPTESPYEERQRGQARQCDGPRPVKRRRKEASPPSKNGYAQSLFGATLTLSGRPLSQASVRHRPPKTSHTCTEMTAPPSLSTSNQDVHPGSTIEITQTRTTSQNVFGHSSKQTSLQSNHAQASTAALSGHSLIRPGDPRHVNPGILDVSEKAPIPQRRQRGPTTDQEEVMANKRPVHDGHHVSRKMGVKLTQRADAQSGLYSELPEAGVSTKRIRERKRLGTENNCTKRKRPPISNIVDSANDRLEGPHKNPNPDEPKTELKIKPRKKRGLLMINERDTTKPRARDSLLPSKAPPVDAPTDQSDEKADFTDTENNHTEFSRKKTGRGGDANNNGYATLRLPCMDDSPYPATEDDGFDGMQYLGQSYREPCEGFKPRNAVEQGEKNDTENIIDNTRRLRPRELLLSTSDIFSGGADGSHERSALAERQNNATIDEIPPPRLAMLGRRGTKSKEVIGLVDDELDKPGVSAQEKFASDLSPDHQIIGNQHPHRQGSNMAGDGLAVTRAQPNGGFQSWARSLPAAKGSNAPQRQNSESSKLTADATNQTVQGEGAESIVAATFMAKQPIPPIPNPATRGKKAAKPSDAAGKMPVSPLPMESVSGPSLQQTSGRTNFQRAVGSESETKNTMPGFFRVNGGPWSREAYDLFDFRRPP